MRAFGWAPVRDRVGDQAGPRPDKQEGHSEPPITLVAANSPGPRGVGPSMLSSTDFGLSQTGAQSLAVSRFLAPSNKSRVLFEVAESCLKGHQCCRLPWNPRGTWRPLGPQDCSTRDLKRTFPGPAFSQSGACEARCPCRKEPSLPTGSAWDRSPAAGPGSSPPSGQGRH